MRMRALAVAIGLVVGPLLAGCSSSGRCGPCNQPNPCNRPNPCNTPNPCNQPVPTCPPCYDACTPSCASNPWPNWAPPGGQSGAWYLDQIMQIAIANQGNDQAWMQVRMLAQQCFPHTHPDSGTVHSCCEAHARVFRAYQRAMANDVQGCIAELNHMD